MNQLHFLVVIFMQYQSTSRTKNLFINHESIKNSPITAEFLPKIEKAISAGRCNNSVIVLCLNSPIFSSSIESGKSAINFSIVEEIAGEEIICFSGFYEHFITISK